MGEEKRLIHITNSTDYEATGVVHHQSDSSEVDGFTIPAKKDWTGLHRGLFKLSAVLHLPDGKEERAHFEPGPSPNDYIIERGKLLTYTPVSIANNTRYRATGTVTYLSWFCDDDNYPAISPGGEWQASGRGECLVTKITATIRLETGDVQADPYESPGTSYSAFKVEEDSPGHFVVRRI
ncbi:hypothetical protein HK104_011039 [Borealophlyctis nickersoniae]|nr:hypothetical protein HK104_011039 [Borealophlyctis nickersoniae]